MTEPNTRQSIYAKCDAIEPDQWDCWNYPGMTNAWGYCVVEIGGRKYRVHRLMLERKLGRKLEPGEHALHTCDNPRCCNPEHLYAGSNQDNVWDKMERNPEALEQIRELGRRPRTAKQLVHIAGLHKRPKTAKQLAQARRSMEAIHQRRRQGLIGGVKGIDENG